MTKLLFSLQSEPDQAGLSTEQWDHQQGALHAHKPPPGSCAHQRPLGGAVIKRSGIIGNAANVLSPPSFRFRYLDRNDASDAESSESATQGAFGTTVSSGHFHMRAVAACADVRSAVSVGSFSAAKGSSTPRPATRPGPSRVPGGFLEGPEKQPTSLIYPVTQQNDCLHSFLLQPEMMVLS